MRVGEVMNRLYYTYSLAKALYERGSDYIDVFWSFVLRVLSENGTSMSLVSIQEKLKESRVVSCLLRNAVLKMQFYNITIL